LPSRFCIHENAMRLVDFAIVRALSSLKSFFPRPSEGNRDAVAVLKMQ